MSKQDYTRKFTKEEINAMPIARYEGEVILVRDAKTLKSALKKLHQERVLGFDTETKPSFRKGKLNPPALIQLAAEHAVYLIQLTWIPLNKEMARLLSNPDVLKVGVSIHDDMRELQKVYDFEPAGIVDLGLLAKQNKLETKGLRNLAANFFDCRITKGPQCSNWNAHELSHRQISYAATDAWVGRKVFLRMEELGMVHGV